MAGSSKDEQHAPEAVKEIEKNVRENKERIRSPDEEKDAGAAAKAFCSIFSFAKPRHLLKGRSPSFPT